MNNELQLVYEQIDNYILRLLLIFGAAVIASMAGAIIYMYRERGALLKEMVEMNRESTQTYNEIAQSLEEIHKSLEEIRGSMLKRLLK